MRAGAAPGHDSYVHEAAIYDSDDELVRLVVPHVEAGVAAGEPTYLALHEREAAVVRATLSTPGRVTFLPPPSSQKRPPAAIRTLTAQLRQLIAGGAQQVRAVNTVPHPGLGAVWEGWCQYEAAVNELLAGIPVWGLCLYDRRITPSYVLDDVARTHPHLATPDGRHERNDRYEDPTTFLRSRPAPPPDPIEAGPPAIEMLDPTPRAGRQAVGELARRNGLPADEVEDLVLATSEAISNATSHRQGQVSVKAWAASPPRVVVTVSDEGEGLGDVYVGLAPRASAFDGEGGLGLWLSNQLVEVSYVRNDHGFTVRLNAGDPGARRI